MLFRGHGRPARVVADSASNIELQTRGTLVTPDLPFFHMRVTTPLANGMLTTEFSLNTFEA